jgi:hypothetical protein
VVDDEAHGIGFPCGKPAGRRVGMKIQGLDELQDPAPGVIADACSSIDDPGDSAFGNVCHFGDVINGHKSPRNRQKYRYL